MTNEIGSNEIGPSEIRPNEIRPSEIRPSEIRLDTWVYVLVQDPGNHEHIVGQEDTEHELAFIPAFLDKDAATQGVAHMIKEKGYKYEVQAILFEDLINHTIKGNFLIFVLDDDGVILKKFSPDGTPL